jgi:hypothetical protein
MNALRHRPAKFHEPLLYFMAQPFIILADRGRVRMFAVEEVTGRHRLRSVADTLMVEPRLKISEKYADHAGARSHTGNGAIDFKNSDEQLGIGREEDKRLFEFIGDKINALLQEHGVERWHFAAPSESNASILEHVDPRLRSRLGENVKKDLVNVEIDNIAGHFNISLTLKAEARR